MQHPYDEIQNVRMPRACKRTRPYQQQNFRQIRRTRGDVQREMLQQQQQQQNAMYTTTAQMQHEYSAYAMQEPKNLHVNNNLHPIIQQLPRPPQTYTPTPRQRAVHSAPNMQAYWRSSQATQMPITTPLQRSASPKSIPVQTTEASIQTETAITENEINLLKALRKEKIDIAKFYAIIERSDYIVAFEDNNDELDEQNNAMEPTSNEIVCRNTMQQNDMLTLAYAAKLQQRLASLMPSANLLPAIEYNTEQNDPDVQESCDATDHENGNYSIAPLTLESTPFFNEHQEVADNPFSGGELIAPELISVNTLSSPIPGSISYGEQQVPPPRFPIPTITGHFRNNSQTRYQEPNFQEYGIPNFQQHPDNNNNNIQLLQALIGQYYENHAHLQYPHGWDQGPNIFQ